jgi:hypothetical protein
MDMEKIIDLKYAIPLKTKDGVTQLKQLTMTRFKAKHLKLLPKNTGTDGKVAPEKMIPIIAGLTNIPIDSADEIDMDDLIVLSKELESFLPTSPEETGEVISGE